jgi:AcrR family transcriptional regulator
MRGFAHIRYSHRAMSKQPVLTPRKLPRQRRAQATVDAILEASARILERDGLAGFTTNAVAERAGVSIGSLYQYFPSKHALTVALIARERGALRQEVVRAAGAPSGHSAIRGMIAAAVRHQLHRPALARVLDFAESRLPADDDGRQMSTAVRELVAEVLARPDLASSRPASAVSDVLAMVRGILDAAGERGETDAADLEGRVGRAVFGYLGLPP